MKDKRKTRLNKTQGTKTEFVGFGAFVDTHVVASGDGLSSPSTNKQATLRWSPIYTGKDNNLATIVFPRIIKRDATTKVKALQELQEYFRKESIGKKQQVDALGHYMFLYHCKLAYDSSSSVRSEAVLVLTLAAQRVPKAFSALVQQNNRQILGMMYSCHGDPAAEVRTMVSKHMIEEAKSTSIGEDPVAYSLEDLEAGVWDYVHRILSYGRANKMQEDLFATSSSNSKGGSTGELTEAQKDQLEERFERIVGTAMSGMQGWIHRHGIVSKDNNPLIHSSHKYLWKTMSSPKSSLRNRTYSLLATCCQKSPEIIFNNQQAFSQTLPQALSSEKEPGNVAALLEALLAFLAAYSKYNTGSPWDSCFNSTSVTKSLVKIFRKSCYGAAATQWGPSLLPLLAMLPSLSDQVAVLAAAWKGREQTVRLGDHLVVVQTVSESASFFLLRKQKEKEEEVVTKTETDAKELAQLWIDCLQNFFESKTSKSKASMGGPVRQSQVALAKALAKEIQQFNEDRPTSAVHPIRDWFWQEQVRESILKVEEYDTLALLVQEMDNPQSESSPSSSSYLSTILRTKFRKVLAAFQDRSGAVPTVDAYELMIAILQYCGIQVLELNDNEIHKATTAEKFLMNDVLRWMVIHTSRLSTQQQSKALAQKDFTLFGICAVDLPSEGARAKLWEALLREVIAANCRLDLLVAGLTALLRQDKTWNERVQCDLLDQFAIQVVGDSLEQEGTPNKLGDDSDGEEHEDKSAFKAFLQTVSGLHPGIPSLVRPSVLTVWVKTTCENEVDVVVPTSVLETLVSLSFAPSRLSEGEILCVLLQCWRQGGEVWKQHAMALLLKEPGHLTSLVARASVELKSTLIDWSAKPGDEKADEVAVLWSERAWRLLSLKQDTTAHPAETLPAPSLELVGLAELSVWESTDFPYACLMRLLGNATSSAERLNLLQHNNATKFIISLLIALSGASTEGIAASRTSRQQDRCAQLLSALGGRSGLPKQLLASWLKACIAQVALTMEKGNPREIEKGVAVISQLCCLMIDRVNPERIMNASEDDDDDDDLSEDFEREKIAKLFVPLLGSKPFAALPWTSCISELVNVVMFYCGVGDERGIGSLHYDMLQLVLGTEGRLRTLLSDSDKVNEGDAIQEIWKLALSCGFGLNTPFSEWNSLLPFEPDKITGSILEYFNKHMNGIALSDLGRAVLSWLVTASPKLRDKDLLLRSLKLLYKESISLLSRCSAFDKDTLLALRGIQVAQLASKKNHVDVENLGTQALMRIVASLVGQWEDSRPLHGVIGQPFDGTCHPIQSIQPAWRVLSPINDIISFAIAQEGDLLVAATSDFVDDLVRSLFVASKRWYAFRLLDAIAHSTQFQGDPTPEEDTARRLSGWTKDMDDEAKSELEEDVEIVCEILPHRLMAEMESWVEEEYCDTLDDQIMIGRMLVWLTCLRFVDAFVRKDPSNRPSLCAYLDKSGGTESILNQTLLHTGVGTEKGAYVHATVDVEQLLQTETLLDRVSLASLVLFRTVETLPPLSRRWWEQECPNVYTGAIRDYIEAQVAPKILEKELESLKFATIKNPALSALTVTGSVTTREITATYTQDEIKLAVSIALPGFYPLRNAEVDCSQTLGIPAKRWKLWSLQITMMLNNQGGTLQEALMLWKENVDQEFEGVEPCPVCYSVLHVKTHKLPELECTTCSNRFHTQCLTQWFRSSGKTQCVLCQQPWVGTKVKR